jgi:hypothetical protein
MEMNRQVNNERKIVSSLCAAAALITALTIVASIGGLARHYHVEAQLAAGAGSVVVASDKR